MPPRIHTRSKNASHIVRLRKDAGCTSRPNVIYSPTMLRLRLATNRMTSVRQSNPLRIVYLAWFLCSAASLTSALGAGRYDILIESGLVYDGSFAPARTADVGIKGGVIVAIGRLESDARHIIDANGLIVAPGFIDIHTHATFSEAQIAPEDRDDVLSLEDRRAAKNYLFQAYYQIILARYHQDS